MTFDGQLNLSHTSMLVSHLCYMGRPANNLWMVRVSYRHVPVSPHNNAGCHLTSNLEESIKHQSNKYTHFITLRKEKDTGLLQGH